MTEVESLLTEHGIYFRPAGKDILVRCLNPEHPDSNPSMRIDRITGTFGCFSCGFKGNIFSYFNIVRDYQSERVLQVRKKIQDIIISTQGRDMPEGFSYINKDFKGVPKETLRTFDAFIHDDDEFKDRIVFPIKDISGRIIAFSGRKMYSSTPPKYLNSPAEVEIPLYPAKVKPIFSSIILVEGIFDMINLHHKGLHNAVCCFGTRKLSDKTVTQKLSPYRLQGVTTIYIMFDGDAAGRKAAEDTKELIKRRTDFVVDTIALSDDIDPGVLTLEDVLHIKEALYTKKEQHDSRLTANQ